MMFTKKSMKDGHEIVDGVFRAISRNKVPNPPQNFNTQYYYATNKGYTFNNNNKLYYGKSNSNSDFWIIKRIILIIIIALIMLLVFDFFSMYTKVKRDNKIERERCFKEYEENECDKIKIDDGPILNDACVEREKCIKDYEVYFHEVLIRYIKNVVFHFFKDYSYVNTIIILITVLIIFRIIF